MKKTLNQSSVLMLTKVEDLILPIRNEKVILDADVASLYGVETRRINEAVRNNPEKFPASYMFTLTKDERDVLRSKFSTTKFSTKSRALPKAFTEKGLYMLATILKSPVATAATFAIIETFSTVRELKNELIELHQKGNLQERESKMKKFGKLLADIIMPDLKTTETESILELNFILGKVKHTVKRVKKVD